jgi:hypothetical protein
VLVNSLLPFVLFVAIIAGKAGSDSVATAAVSALSMRNALVGSVMQGIVISYRNSRSSTDTVVPCYTHVSWPVDTAMQPLHDGTSSDSNSSEHGVTAAVTLCNALQCNSFVLAPLWLPQAQAFLGVLALTCDTRTAAAAYGGIAHCIATEGLVQLALAVAAPLAQAVYTMQCSTATTTAVTTPSTTASALAAATVAPAVTRILSAPAPLTAVCDVLARGRSAVATVLPWCARISLWHLSHIAAAESMLVPSASSSSSTVLESSTHSTSTQSSKSSWRTQVSSMKRTVSGVSSHNSSSSSSNVVAASDQLATAAAALGFSESIIATTDTSATSSILGGVGSGFTAAMSPSRGAKHQRQQSAAQQQHTEQLVLRAFTQGAPQFICLQYSSDNDVDSCIESAAYSITIERRLRVLADEWRELSSQAVTAQALHPQPFQVHTGHIVVPLQITSIQHDQRVIGLGFAVSIARDCVWQVCSEQLATVGAAVAQHLNLLVPQNAAVVVRNSSDAADSSSVSSHTVAPDATDVDISSIHTGSSGSSPKQSKKKRFGRIL